MDQPNAAELAGTEGAGAPFFSPDGRWVGFLAGGKMNKISVDSGAVVPLNRIAATAGGSNATWGEAGIFFGRPLAGVVRIPADGGDPAPVTELVDGEFGHLLPQILPGGKAVLFAAYPAPAADGAGIEAVSRTTIAERNWCRAALPPYMYRADTFSA